MQCLPISYADSCKLTELVEQHQAQPKNNFLYHQAHQKTQYLLYEIPSYLHILSKEDCGEFLLFCYDTIDYYLTSFKKGRLSYYSYLVEVVKKRCRYFIARRAKKEWKEQILIENEYYQQQAVQIEDQVLETSRYTTLRAQNLEHVRKLPYLFEQLINTRVYAQSVLPKKLWKLKKALDNPVNRKRFIILLTLSPELTQTYLLEDLALVLDTDVLLLNSYLNTASQALKEKQKCKQEFEIISNRHFRRLLEIESELMMEHDLAKQKKLQALRMWTLNVYKAKIEQIRSIESHLSHSQVGVLLNIPKGTIDSSIHYMRNLIKECMDEKPDNRYL